LLDEPLHHTERDALNLAVDNLRDIQQTKLGFPPWEKKELGSFRMRRVHWRSPMRQIWR